MALWQKLLKMWHNSFHDTGIKHKIYIDIRQYLFYIKKRLNANMLEREVEGVEFWQRKFAYFETF